jgi:hypothetical protein
MFSAEERELARFHSLSAQSLSSIIVSVPDRAPIHVQDNDAIASFVELAHRAELFFPSHEGSSLDFSISLEPKGGASEMFGSRVPEQHESDVAIHFRASITYGDILLPGGHAWLRKVMQNAS